MKIARTIIENFRGHKRTELEFADHHVLVGENGSGKTAVLEAINYATSSYYLSSRLDEQDFNNADAEAIKITVEFDKPFAVKCPDGYTHQNLLSKSVQLYAKRRDKAAPGKTFSDPFVVSHICIPITFQKKSDIAELVLPDGVTMNDLPTSVVETQEGFAVQRKTGKVMNLRRDTLSLTNDLAAFRMSSISIASGSARPKRALIHFSARLQRISIGAIEKVGLKKTRQKNGVRTMTP